MWRYLNLTVIGIVMVVGCRYYHQDISILESVPYVEYGCGTSPDPLDGPIGFGVGAKRINTSTDIDTSINAFGPDLLIRRRFSKVEVGYFATNSLQKNHLLPYGILDLKVFIIDKPLLVAPDFAVGLGVGKAGFMFDGRSSLILGLSLFDGLVCPYVAPKAILLFYPYEKSGIIPTLKWTGCGISGLSGGMGISIPLEVEDERVIRSVKFVPEVSYISGREPKQNRIGFSVFQLGGRLIFTF